MVDASRLAFIFLTFIPLCYLDLISSTMEQHQVFARCPNGSQMAPDGNCELVTSNGGLPRCPDGYHRSPSGNCEPFNNYNPSSSYQQPQIPQQLPPQQFPLQQPPLQPQLQQGQPLYNPDQVVACLNHVLVDSIVKAGTTPNLTLHNSTKGAAPALNQTFIQNATQTLDSCIMPINQ
jgi:hypothetical protein